MAERVNKVLKENISHDELKKLDFKKLETLSSEIRGFLIDSVSKTGGHLASNLGVVELSVMLHRCFDFNKDDRIIFDVGHQCYTHKILTGRLEGFSRLRKKGGISGFPRRDESATDLFDVGHSGTALSLADGIASAKKMLKENGKTIAVVGDGALTGGLCYEALNNIGEEKNNLLIILNDNGMSISKNVGALSKLLVTVRASKSYRKAKTDVKGVLSGTDIGETIERALKTARAKLKFIITPNNFIESFGVKYFGPIDGHDLKELEFYLEKAKEMSTPVLLHVKTVKGKGYSKAQAHPSRYHGVAKFEVEKGATVNIKNDFSSALGLELAKLGMEKENLAVICPAMGEGCGLAGFAECYPSRFFDCGIAEEHAVTFAAGLAKGGAIPVVCTYSTFMQRAYDQIWHDVCINNLHVVFCIDRAGLPGEDGKTHQGIYDLSYLGNIPGMTVLSPSSFAELSKMLDYAVKEHKGPIAIRYPKGADSECGYSDFTFGKAEVVKEGNDVALISEGLMLSRALKAAEIAKEKGVSAKVIKLSTVYPLNIEELEKVTKGIEKVITLEGNIRRGGMGEAIFTNIKKDVEIIAFPTEFIEHGETAELLKDYDMDEEAIAEKIVKLAEKK